MKIGQLWGNKHIDWLYLRVMDFPRENKVLLMVEPKNYPSTMAGVTVEWSISDLERGYVPILEDTQEASWEV